MITDAMVPAKIVQQGHELALFRRRCSYFTNALRIKCLDLGYRCKINAIINDD